MCKKQCECDSCSCMNNGMSKEEAFETIKRLQEKKMEEHGWIIHLINDDPTIATGINIHTHGLEDNFDHADLQFVIDTDAQVVQTIIGTIVSRIKKGEKFTEASSVDGILKDHALSFCNAEESGRTVLRIIIPKEIIPEDLWKAQFSDIKIDAFVNEILEEKA